jgi:hypothetical protein
VPAIAGQSDRHYYLHVCARTRAGCRGRPSGVSVVGTAPGRARSRRRIDRPAAGRAKRGGGAKLPTTIPLTASIGVRAASVFVGAWSSVTVSWPALRFLWQHAHRRPPTEPVCSSPGSRQIATPLVLASDRNNMYYIYDTKRDPIIRTV